jgi:hypothetical protein
MVCGIGSLVLACVSLGFLAGVAAIITGVLARKRQPHARGFWLSGLITGSVGAAIGLIQSLFWIVLVVTSALTPGNYTY